MYRRIVVSMLLCGLVTAACVYGAASLLFTRIYDSSKEASLREAEDRLGLFNLAISRVERDSLANGRLALAELAARLRPEGLERMTRSALAAEARELGISDIYFIDHKGRVLATSFWPDQGLDLFSLGGGFADFLKRIYGRGLAVDQGLSESSMTGTVNIYQYYSPKGSDYIIEISTRLNEAIGRSFPGLDYEGFVSLAFGVPGGEGTGQKPLASIVDLVAVRGISTWSLFQKKTEESRYASLVASAKANQREETWVWGPASTILVRPVSLSRDGTDDSASTYYAVFEIDLGPFARFKFFALLSALGACGLAVALSFVAMKRSFDRNVAARIERLRAGIRRASEGDYDAPSQDYGRDEIGDIGRNVDFMVKTILEKEERLRAAQRMETVGAMAGGLAHDFNNVLTGITGTIECMELRIAGGEARGEELLELTSLATRTAKRGGDLVRSLLDIAVTRPPVTRPFELGSIAREAAELAGEVSREGVVIRVEAPERGLTVRCDEQAVLRAALNLCINGIQAMTVMKGPGEAQGGVLFVKAEARAPAEAAIVVEDQGVGIAAEDRVRILTPFYSTKPRGLGTGIGLAIALSVAESHGGRLEIESEPGSGSKFAIVLPV